MNILGMFGPIELILILFVLLLPIIAIINLLKSTFKSGADKIVWLIVIILIPILGSLLYFLLSSSQKVK
jgi:Phospholipase_D-nuclease N-terminal